MSEDKEKFQLHSWKVEPNTSRASWPEPKPLTISPTQVTPYQEIKYHTVQRGEITRKYRRGAKMRFDLQWEINSSKIREVSKSDGVFPLITNSRDLSALELFNAYRSKQPVVEKRHDLFKNILESTPAYLKNIGRLEALLFLEFIALIVHALIERQLRQQMQKDQIESIPLYPEERSCKAPTTTRLIDLFEPVQSHCLKEGNVLVQQFLPQLNDLQKTMTGLVGLGPGIYQNISVSGQI